MKTPLLLLLCFKILCCGLASGRDEAALAALEERAKNVATSAEASEIALEVLNAKDYDRMEICLRYPRTANLVIRHYAETPASDFKDRLTVDLIARPWVPPAEDGGSRPAINPEILKRYVDYMRERLGDEAASMGSPEDLLKPDATDEDREVVARRFKNAVLKTGIGGGKSSPRPSKNWVPGEEAKAGEGGDTGSTTLWIVCAAVLVVAAGGFFVYKKRGA